MFSTNASTVINILNSSHKFKTLKNKQQIKCSIVNQYMQAKPIHSMKHINVEKYSNDCSNT